MAGHSKWKNIQHRKGRQDAKRAKMFTKISKEIFTSVRNGGTDIQTNHTLRLAIDKAREANMPNDNIERTIKKAVGDVDGISYEEIIYEGYGPNGVAIMVEVLTDNRNRSAADIRHIFSRHGGNLGETGCVAYMFERKGLLVVAGESSPLDEEMLMMEAIESGAEDVAVDDDTYEITTAVADYETVKEELQAKQISFESAQITMIPTITVDVDEETTTKMVRLIDDLEDHDDVQQVHTNASFSNEILHRL